RAIHHHVDDARLLRIQRQLQADANRPASRGFGASRSRIATCLEAPLKQRRPRSGDCAYEAAARRLFAAGFFADAFDALFAAPFDAAFGAPFAPAAAFAGWRSSGAARLAFSASIRSMILCSVSGAATPVISSPSTLRLISSSIRSRDRKSVV